MMTGSAAARVGLLGNPSDGYGGRVLAMTVPQFVATATLTPNADWSFDGSELLEATVQALRDRRPELVAEPAAVRFDTTIPRQVGLAGSSAIVMATLRALGDRSGHRWDLVELARVALEVETEVLGWAAGPQDRVVQAYTGLVDMDFATPWCADRYERLDASRLPPLFLAWDQSTGAPSDVVHADVRQRWLDGDPHVRATMASFADLAARGRRALDSGTAAEQWPALLDRAFELRSQIWNITSVDTALIETARKAGAGVAFAGSGGAVVGAVRAAEQLADVERAYLDAGVGFVVLNPLANS